jgi:putative Mn2+ efflux pump MntP
MTHELALVLGLILVAVGFVMLVRILRLAEERYERKRKMHERRFKRIAVRTDCEDKP